MRITVERAALAHALAQSSTNFTEKGAKSEAEQVYVDDIYESIMIESSDEGAFIHATDGNVWTRARIPSEGEGLGRVMIKSSQIGQIVRNLGDGDVELQVTNDKTMILTSGSYRATFPARPAIEYPPAPSVEAGRWSTINGEDLKRLVEASAVCAYDKPDRPALCGINLETLGADIWAVAADGARILTARLRTPVERFPLTMTLPVVFARHAASMASSGPIDFGMNNFGMAVFKTDAMTIVGKCVGQPFPDWRSARNLPKEDEPAAWGEFEVKLLSKAGKRVMSVIGKNDIPALIVGFRDGVLELSMEWSGKSSEEKVTPGEWGGPPAFRMINGSKFGQILGAVSTDKVMVRVPCNPDHPVGIKELGDDDNFSAQYWVMPRKR
jgi:DNA polymerase III sliding clamp (beta) subunit (PCNA family)